MTYYVDLLFPIPFWICVALVFRTHLRQRSSRTATVAGMFFFGALAFTLFSPPTFRAVTALTGVPNLARVLSDISCLIALFFGYRFLTLFGRERLPLWSVGAATVVTAALLAFFFSESGHGQELLFTVDAPHDAAMFAYGLVFLTYFTAVFGYCAYAFSRHAQSLADPFFKGRLILLFIGCFAGFINGLVKTVLLVVGRYSSVPSSLPSWEGRLLAAVIVAGLAAGASPPRFLEPMITSLGEFTSLRKQRLDLISLLTLINDARTDLLPHTDKRFMSYVKSLCEALQISTADTLVTLETARLMRKGLGRRDGEQEPDDYRDDDYYRGTSSTAGAFWGEIHFYAQVRECLSYARARYDNRELPLSGPWMPIGSRILGVVDGYLEAAESPAFADAGGSVPGANTISAKSITEANATPTNTMAVRTMRRSSRTRRQAAALGDLEPPGPSRPPGPLGPPGPPGNGEADNRAAGAVEVLRQQAGSRFDPGVVDAFCKLVTAEPA